VASGKGISEIIVGREVRTMLLAPNGMKAFIATSFGSADDTQLLVYDLEARKQLAGLPEVFDGHRGFWELKAARFLSDDRYIEIALRDGSFFRWDTSTGQRDREFVADWRDDEQRRQNNPKLWMGYSVFNPDGSRLFVSTNDTLTVWDTQTGALVRRQTFKDIAHGFRLDISPEGKTLVGAQVNYAGDPGTDTIRLWDAETGKERLLLEPRARANEFAFSPDGTKLLTGFYRGTAILWDIR
jgi:WD40 repeat protein